jgi:diguanylate cyclase (GGDEF)-like protein
MLPLNLFKITKILTLVLALICPIQALCKGQNLTDDNTKLSASNLALTSQEKAWLAQHKLITVGVKHSWKPVEFVSDQKKFRGITMDYLHKLEPLLGVEFQMFNIDDISTQETDILSSVSNPKTIDTNKYTLTNPILKFSYAIYVHKNNNNIDDSNDLNGKNVAVFSKGQLVNFLNSDYPNIRLRKTDIIEEAFIDVDARKSDAYIGNELVVDYEANLQGIGFLKKVGYVPIETELTMAVRKDWPIFLSILNKSFIALEPQKNNILNNWHMSQFQEKNILIAFLVSMFSILASVSLFKAFRLKQKMKSQALEAQELIWHQAHYDMQTNLPNRTLFNKQLSEEIELAKKNNSLIGLLYIDLDAFKEVNDHHGHSIGDELLTQVGKRLKHSVRSSDKVFRLGGDEFTIMLTCLDNQTLIEKTANRIVKTLSDEFEINHLSINITSSVGTTIFPNDAQDVATLIKNADMAMYEAKKEGKNCYKPFVQSMQDLASHRLTISNDLKTAIENNEFVLHYQPIVNLKTNKAVKAEALIRWQHPKNGLVSPAEFIEIAEQTNAIIPIGDWVFKKTLEDIYKLKNAIDSNFSISLNVSPKQFGSNSPINQWPKILEDSNLPTNSIGLEITEGLLLDLNHNSNKILKDLRDAGAQFLLDDFGTGYSSLSYLKKLDVDYIKIDKSFIQNLTSDSEDMVLCEAIIVMAHKLGLKVVAEGVETLQQQYLLIKMGCDFGQGYLFSKPKTIEQLLIDHQLVLAKQINSNLNTLQA